MAAKTRTIKQGTASCPSSVEARIDYIVDRMREFDWDRTSSRQIAAEWGLSIETVKHYTAEASRMVRREISDPDRVTVDVGLKLKTMLDEAFEDARSMRGTKEGLTARDQVGRLGKIWVEIAGAMPPIQVEVSEKPTPEKARALMAELAGHVTPKSDQLN